MIERKLDTVNIFIKNEYYDKYVNLLRANKDRRYEVRKTQCHHIIPRFYYKLNNLKIDNKKDNKINLLYKDHLLAHYYLFFCLNDTKYKLATRYAIDIVLGHKNFPISEKDFIQFLPDIQNFYEQSRILLSNNNPMKIEKHKKHHDNVMRSADVKSKISISMKAVRESQKDYINIHKGNDIGKRISPELLEKYLSDGWELGVKNSGYIKVYKDDKETAIPPTKLSQYLEDGWKRGGRPGRVSKEHREKINKSLNKEVYCIDTNNKEIARFKSVFDAAYWWYDNGYGRTRKKPDNYKYLANNIKKSFEDDVFIEDLKWIYADRR